MLNQRSLNAGNAKVTILSKIAPMVKASQGKPKHLRFQDNKEKQCKLLKSFQKKFLYKNESVTELAETPEDDEISQEQWNQFFSKFENLMCEEGEEDSD